ncbi:PQQ-dependent sugar dehydrogenase [Arthrobacter sp. H5]|uniref:PQQ-dependent sugar dehydrogenase n=1 Tax=Arthrobacter sp. H5 TaxID=1267973 RepID=UPI0004B2EFD1|nr:PQQ-dependent sugar dehydrogenase [Arthrobacter sp. H5]
MNDHQRVPGNAGPRVRGRLGAAATIFVLMGCTAAPEPDPIFQGGSGQPPSSSATPQAAESTEPDNETAGAETADPVSPPTAPALSVVGELASGLGTPWSMIALPDGSALVSDRETGEIIRIVDGNTSVVGVIDDAVAAGGEGGLLGLAIGPDFDTEPRLFMYYTSPSDNRVVSNSYSPEGLGEQVEVLTGIPKANIHNGGRIKFGPDGFLYIGTGDASVGENSQDPSSLGGKILRVTADGDPAPGNPTAGSAMYSLGHRNVQGLAWDSEGQLWASEFGPEIDDELNLIAAGNNYGWPEVTGAPGREGFTDAQVVWPSTATSSPSGMAIVGDVAYIGGLRGQRLWQVPLANGSAGMPVSHFDGEFGRLRDVVESTDGALWVATNEDGDSRIVRVEEE